MFFFPYCIRSIFCLTFLYFTLIFSVRSFASSIPTDQKTILQGKVLFDENCTVCHALQEEIIGPALKDVHTKHTIPWLSAFINNSQQVIQSGDEYAKKLYESYNQTQMTSFDFSDDQILAILAYIKQATEDIAQQATTKTAQSASQPSSTIDADSITKFLTKKNINIFLLGLAVILLLILVVLLIVVIFLIKLMVKATLQQPPLIQDIDTKKITPVQKFGKFLRKKPVMFIIISGFLAIVIKSTINGLYSIGIQQGYAPKQPIAFSHKLHAGKFEIDCQYCHTGVQKSKNANIPSANICMNCHSSIKKESPEIQKIHQAVKNNTPIEWVRVHNLPKLAYFNHAQHVAVGKVDCEQCHGPVSEMDVLRQHAPLTMGWCIDCHRQSEVNVQGNAYYDRLLKLHQNKTDKPLTVEEMGGLECGKCHY